MANYTPAFQTSAKFDIRLNQEINNLYSGKYGKEFSREKVIEKLKSEFPNIDVAKIVYTKIPDNYEQKIKPKSTLDKFLIPKKYVPEAMKKVETQPTELSQKVKDFGSSVNKFVKKALVEYPAREGAGATLELAGKLDPRSPKEYKPTTKFGKWLFGKETVKPLSKYGEETLGGFGMKEQTAQQYGLMAGAAMLGLEFVGAGGKQKTIQALVRANKADDVLKILKTANVTDNLAKGYSKTIATMTKAEDIEKTLFHINKLQKSGQTAEKVINLDRLNISQKSKKNLTNTIDEVRPELENIKGGVLRNEEVIEAAKKSDVLRKVVSKEATLKTEAALLKTRQQLAKLAKEETVTKEFVETLKVVKSEGTKRARALQALGIEADPILGNIKAKVIKQLLELGKSVDDIVAASKGVDFNDAEQLTKFYRQYVKPTLPEMIDEYRYINLLSSPKTHIVNSFTNLLQVTALRPATRLASGMIDNVASKLTGKAQEYYIKQVPAYYKGVYNAVGDASKGFMDAVRGKSLVYRPDLSRIPTGSKLLRPFQYVTRLLEGSDIFFRTLATGGEMEALLKSGVTKSKAVKEAADTASELVFRKALDPKNKTGHGLVLSAIDNITTAI